MRYRRDKEKCKTRQMNTRIARIYAVNNIVTTSVAFNEQYGNIAMSQRYCSDNAIQQCAKYCEYIWICIAQRYRYKLCASNDIVAIYMR